MQKLTRFEVHAPKHELHPLYVWAKDSLDAISATAVWFNLNRFTTAWAVIVCPDMASDEQQPFPKRDRN